MIIIQQPGFLSAEISRHREKGQTIGFVPTMGALHDGHIGLVNYSAEQSDITVCSIFINPTQFNDSLDYKKYPNRPENDIKLLESSGAGILFRPPAEVIYPDGTGQLEQYDLGFIDTILEGKFRPSHFQGVCQVMYRLLNAVKPDLLFMGQKDYQQCLVISRLLEYLDFKVTLIACPTLRDPDGLAMSSRNLRLTAGQRSKAPNIYKSLLMAKDKIRPGELQTLKHTAVNFLEQNGFRVDYFEIADKKTLRPIDHWDGSSSIIALVAAFMGDVRLIDNMILHS